MNGRVYDYNLGRFLSVDPFIQEPGNSQSMNPYSYIMNNPLSGTDPSGYKACDVEASANSCGVANGETADITRDGEKIGTATISKDGKSMTTTSTENGSSNRITVVSGKMTAIENIGAVSDVARNNPIQTPGGGHGGHLSLTGAGTIEGIGSPGASTDLGKIANKIVDVLVDGLTKAKKLSYIGALMSTPLGEDDEISSRTTASQKDIRIATTTAELTIAENNVELYGPYSRRETKTQTRIDAIYQTITQTIGGGIPSNGQLLKPTVQAFNGVLPQGTPGVEFYTKVKPSSVHPGYVNWILGSPGVHKSVNGMAVIPVLLYKNTQVHPFRSEEK